MRKPITAATLRYRVRGVKGEYFDVFNKRKNAIKAAVKLAVAYPGTAFLVVRKANLKEKVIFSLKIESNHQFDDLKDIYDSIVEVYQERLDEIKFGERPMNTVVLDIALAGGLFAILAFIHFFVDWIFQSHAEAMVKHNNPKIRAKHCLIYTLGFLPMFWLCHFTWWEWLIGVNVLFWSHFCEDTYIPVYLWAKYIRRPPEMMEPIKTVGLDGYVSISPPDPKVGFGLFVQTPLGKILMIAIDQIIHLAFLFPIVWMAMQHVNFDTTSKKTRWHIEEPPDVMIVDRWM